VDGREIPFERSVEVMIPPEAVHRVSCTGPDPLIFIETQIGTYCGEDDLIRIEDDYKRT
jgi:mannose-6-phosphate isomerase-like protein (cupin superfamily)